MAHAGGLIAVGVERDSIMLLRLQPQNLGGDVFERAQQFTIALQQKAGVRPLALHVDVAPLKAVGISGACACGDSILSRRPPVEVRMRIREATFSDAWARSSMGFGVLRGKVGCFQCRAAKETCGRRIWPGQLTVKTDSENISKFFELPGHDTQKRVFQYDANWTRSASRSRTLSPSLNRLGARLCQCLCLCLCLGALHLDLAHLASECRAIQYELLPNHNEIADVPVECQSRGIVPRPVAREGRHHERHHPLLCRIDPGRRRVELYEKTSDDHDDRQDVPRVRLTQVRQPVPVRLPQLDYLRHHGEEGE